MIRSLAPVLAASVLFIVGCARGDAGPARIPVYPVEGKLLVAGRPASGARLAFHPVAGGPADACPVGVAGPDGEFVLTTYAFGDGAPAGEYAVTVLWPNETLPPVDECVVVNPAAHDRLNGYYFDPSKRRLLATVHPGPNPITLRITVGSSGWTTPKQGPK